MNWNIGILKKRLNPDSTILLQDQCHDHSLKQQRKAAIGPGPGNINQVSSTFVTLGPWHSGSQVRFVLEKVQMPPRFLHCVKCL